MSQQKNQHFVPKCYLKPFSFNQEGKAINLFNVAENRAIRSVSVKGQCSKNFFYGRDLRLENALSSTEAMYAKVLVKLYREEELTPDDLYILKSFTLLQYLRTEQSVEIYKQQHQQFIEAVAQGPETSAVIEPMEHQHTIVLAMQMFADCLYIVDDLEACICDTLGKNQFITSDDPAVLTNKFNLQKLKQDGFGLGSSGVLFFLPLSPRYLLLVYDPNIYTIDNKSHLSPVKGKDVEALNELQFIRAENNIYFSEWDSRHSFPNKLSKYRKSRPEKWSVTEVFIKDENIKNQKSSRYRTGSEDEIKKSRESLIAMRPIHAYPSKWPSILKYKMRPVALSNGSSVGYVRPAFAYRREQERRGNR